MEVDTSATRTGRDSSPVSSPPSSPPAQQQHQHQRRPGLNLTSYPSSDLLVPGKVAAAQGLALTGTLSGGGPSSAKQSAGPDTNPKPKTKKKAAAAAASTAGVNHSRENGASGGNNPTNVDQPKKRASRKPRDPNKPPISRKKQKLTDDGALTNGHAKLVGKTQFPDLMRTSPPPTPSSAIAANDNNNNNNQGPPHHQPLYGPPMQLKPESGNSLKPEYPLPDSSQQQSPRPSSSSNPRYDPVRSTFTETVPDKKSQFVNYGPAPSKSPGRPSPSVASLVHQSPYPPPPDPDGAGAAYASYQSERSANGFASSTQTSANAQRSQLTSAPAFGPMDLDGEPKSATAQPQTKAEGPKDAPSPKAGKPKEKPAPVPLGSGLLSSAAFGGASAAPREYAEVPNQCIVIDVPMNGENGNYVNFMKEVEQKYGFDVAHPRVAEHRKRLKEVAVAGATINDSGPGSADEMIVDASDENSNVEMGGMDDGSAPEGQKRKRRPKTNDYNKDDDFIDDTEMLWEEQALASKDGYFVWCGPLVSEGDRPTVEKTDGTVRRGRGGRGRGGARGETTGRTRGGGAGRGSGGGRGSRGGAAVRKPRVTKGDRAQMESEKAERERMAAVAVKPASYPL